MFNKLASLVLVLYVFECNGHLGILTDIVGGAHEHIHSTVHKVAGGILGGLNVNFQGHVEVGGQRYPNRPPPQPHGGEQTIVVVVEENDDESHGMRPNQHGYDNGNYQNRPGYNNDNHNQGQINHGNQGSGNYAPQYPNQGHNYQQNHDNNYNNGGYNQRPGQNQGNDNNNGGYNQNPGQNQENGGYNQNPGQNQDNNHENGGYNQQQGQNKDNGGYNQRPVQNQGNNNNNGGYNQNPGQNQGNDDYNQRPDQNQHNEPDHNKGSYGQQTTPKQEETRPTFGSIHEDSTQKPTTEKNTDKDEPLFVPLNPNQYNYGGEKDSNNSPKREADGDKATEDKDEDFPIDIRFQDQ